MSPQDLENFISRVQDRVIALETSVRNFTDTLKLLTENIKSLNSHTAEVKGLDSKVSLLNRRIEEFKNEYKDFKIVLDRRIQKFEVKPAEIKLIEPKKRGGLRCKYADRFNKTLSKECQKTR